MTQQSPKQPSQAVQNSLQQPIQLKTTWGKQTESFLDQIFEPLNLIGQRLLGDLWKTFYLTLQDAIALSLLLKIPSSIGKWIIGKDFSSFDVCMRENRLSPECYACFIIVASDFCLWIVLAGRIFARVLRDLTNLKNP